MEPIKITYLNFLILRRNMVKRDGTAPIVFERSSGGGYYLHMSIDGRDVSCKVQKGSSDETDYIEKRQPFVDALHIPDTLEIMTHDFSDDTSWVFGSNNSLYVTQPIPGKIIFPKRFMVKFHKDSAMGSSQDIKHCIWQTADGATPVPSLGTTYTITSGTSDSVFTVSDSSGLSSGQRISVYVQSLSSTFWVQISTVVGNVVTLHSSHKLPVTPSQNDVVTRYHMTPYGSPQMIPGVTNTGWVKVYPANPYDPQEVSVFAYGTWDTEQSKFIPQYKVTEFSFPDLPTLMSKAETKILETGVVESLFDYLKYRLSISLCSEKNERMETKITNDQEIDVSGLFNNADPTARFTGMYASLDGW